MPAARHLEPARRPLPWWSQFWRGGIALLFGVTFWLITAAETSKDFTAAPDPIWLPLVDIVVGLAALVLLLWRRRYPRTVAVLIGLAGAVSTMSAGPWLVVAVSLSTRRRFADILILAVSSLAGAFAFEALVPSPEPLAWWITALVIVLVVVACSTTGWYIGARRDLLTSWQERAETAEREQNARVAEARANERTAIAREMHDVLAHRISLVAMHAGALTFRTDLTAEQTAQAAKIIESNAHLALSDLRDVLGVLRSPVHTPAAEVAARRPQPGWSDVPELLDEARAAGSRVVLTDTSTSAPPTTVGRHAYRVVQEALTNVRKHAPNCIARVTVSGGPGTELVVEVQNPLPRGEASGLPGAGLGLAGLAERAELAGGSLAHGRTPHGGFRVRASFPWPDDPAHDGESATLTAPEVSR